MKVWALLGRRVGDNEQVLALSNHLGWPLETKQLAWKSPLPHWTPVYGRRVGLDNLTDEAKSALHEPWPDLVISVGWRSVPVAQWICQQGGAKHVQLGRPRAPLNLFDLVITAPQYRLPSSDNVLKLAGPLIAQVHKKHLEDLDRWKSEFLDLPAPRIAVLIGGDAPPLQFTREAVTNLARRCNDLAETLSGSLLITTGPRTPPWALDLFSNQIEVPSFQNAWGATDKNPYSAFLELADLFVVTNDSISMAQEALSTGKPLFLFNIPVKNGPGKILQAGLNYASRDGNGLLTAFINKLVSAGIIYLPRFPQDYHAGLIRDGRAVILGSASPILENYRIPDDMETAAKAVKQLVRDKEKASSDA